VHSEKDVIRRKAIESRHLIAQQSQEKIIVHAKELLMSLMQKHEHLLIGLYFTTKQEISTSPIIDWLNEIGAQCALPRITSYEHKEMAFFLYERGQTMARNKFGIWEPAEAKQVSPSVIVVPVVAADAHGNRLGWGHGYYDKYLSTAGKLPITIGLCYEFQMHYGTLPTEPHDQPLNYVVTENKIYKP
jgi:5-formyltetrahydrofolate cyclo-ligase